MSTVYPALIGLLIQTGFALLTCGLVRKKNAGHLVMLTFSAYVFAVLAYYVAGYGVQSGLHGFLMRGIALDPRAMLDLALMLVTGYVLVGAVCERITFGAFAGCEVFIGALLYPLAAHVVWTGGYRHGFFDFAGSSVVHSLGGFCAMAIAMLLGPRLGKFDREGHPRPFLAHNIVFVAVGTFVVLCGWLALMIGALPMGSLAIQVLAVNAGVAAAAGAAAAMAFWTFRYGKPDISMALNGLLAGIVAVSASGPYIGPNAAVLIGGVAGLLACAGVLFNERTLRLDDPCGSVSVHGYCGWWGAVALGIFANDPEGRVFGLLHGHPFQLVTQVAGATLCAAYAFGLTYLVFAIVNAKWRLRVDAEVEAEGLDLTQFGMLAYPDEDGLP